MLLAMRTTTLVCRCRVREVCDFDPDVPLVDCPLCGQIPEIL